MVSLLSLLRLTNRRESVLSSKEGRLALPLLDAPTVCRYEHGKNAEQSQYNNPVQ
jgi:hypothetical protein